MVDSNSQTEFDESHGVFSTSSSAEVHGVAEGNQKLHFLSLF